MGRMTHKNVIDIIDNAGNSTCTCAVCGETKPIIDPKGNKNFGDGILLPKTTCLECCRKRQEKNKQSKTKKEKKGIENKKSKKGNPITEYLKELR